MRILLALALAFVGVMAIRHTLAIAVRAADPQRAYDLAPRDGRVLGAMAQSLAGVEASAADRNRADQLAVLALRADPTVIPALVTLGLDAQLRGDIAGGQRLLRHAQTLSRRDLRTQVWAIEDAVARNDVAGALRHYDIALRTSRQAPDLLFPVLGAAVGDTDVRSGLARIMATKPRWNELFIPYIAGNGEDPTAVASLFRQLAAASVDIPPASQAMAIARLLPGHPDQAWNYYVSVRPGAQRERSRDPRFTAAITEPTLFDWVPIEDTGGNVVVQHAAGSGLVEFTLPSGNGGMLLYQLQYLPPGDYVLRGHSTDIAQSPTASPYWQLSCEGGRELGRVNVPDSAGNGGWFGGRFTVPGDCPVQRLSLVARPSDAPEGVVGRFDDIRLQAVTAKP